MDRLKTLENMVIVLKKTVKWKYCQPHSILPKPKSELTNNEHKSPRKACGGRRPYWLCSRSHCLDHLGKLAGYRCQVILVDGDDDDGVWWCLNLCLSTILASSRSTDVRCTWCQAIHKIAINQLTDYLHPGMTWCQCSKSSGKGWRASTSPKKPRISMSFIQFLHQACCGSSYWSLNLKIYA